MQKGDYFLRSLKYIRRCHDSVGKLKSPSKPQKLVAPGFIAALATELRSDENLKQFKSACDAMYYFIL